MPKVVVPNEFLCPISNEIMEDPVCTADGHVYDKVNIEKWFERNDTSPVTNLPLPSKTIIPNHFAKVQIQNFVKSRITCSPQQFFEFVKENKLEDIQRHTFSSTTMEYKDGKDKNTPLIEATIRGHIAIVEYLLQEKAKINEPNFKGETALHKAVEKGHLDIVKLLIDNGADKEAKDRYGYTPLLHGCCFNAPNAGSISLLLKSGANIGVKNPHGRGVLDCAMEGNNPIVLKLLKSYGTTFMEKDDEGSCVLHWACNFGAADVIDFLVGEGLSVNAKNQHGETPLILAARTKHPRIKETIENLLRNGASIDEVDSNGNSALHLAATKGYPEVALLLLDYGANLDIKNKNGHTAVELAKLANKPEISAQLQEHFHKIKREAVHSVRIVRDLEQQVEEMSLVINTLVEDNNALKEQTQSMQQQINALKTIIETFTKSQ